MNEPMALSNDTSKLHEPTASSSLRILLISYYSDLKKGLVKTITMGIGKVWFFDRIKVGFRAAVATLGAQG